jgi:FtsP/CotA-like multicopper oxidase with cupredoxin domain
LALVVLLLSSLIISLPVQNEAVAAAPNTGVICTTGISPTPSFTLTARDGYIYLPDGNTSYMWSYTLGSNPFQLPGPVLCVNEGDTVTIQLNNTLKEDTSIAFPGLDGVTANGVPVQPQVDTAGNLTSLVPVAKASTGTITYQFVASSPGTFVYESGTDQGKQINMGLFGGLIVRPKAGANYAYNTPDSVNKHDLYRFNPNNEYLMIMSELDPALHQAVETGKAYDLTLQHPRYWMINGRSFPDTIADNNAAWLPTQPYGSMVRMQPFNSATTSDSHYPALVRYINVGMLNHPFHPHGQNGRVIGRDGRALVSPVGEDLSYENYLVMLGAGQTWDLTYQWTDVDKWNPTTKPIPVTLPQQQNLTYKGGLTWYSGSPYLGVTDGLPAGNTTNNQCGEYYEVWHSHALNEATNFDLGFGGMFTLQRIDPPLATQQANNHLCS